MLTAIRIKNLALVADLTLELQPGYNAITGETGAGKSIIIGALNLVLGEARRPDADSRRQRQLLGGGSFRCVPIAVFRLKRFSKTTAWNPARTASLCSSALSTSPPKRKSPVHQRLADARRAGCASGEWLVDTSTAPARSSIAPASHGQTAGDPRRVWRFEAAQGGVRGAWCDVALRLESEKSALIVDERTYAQQL